MFLLVEASHAPRVAMGLRVRDLSRQLDTWGAEIPIVQESDFRSGNADLLDIPIKPGFRQMLRVYDLDPTRGPALSIVSSVCKREPWAPGDGVSDQIGTSRRLHVCPETGAAMRTSMRTAAWIERLGAGDRVIVVGPAAVRVQLGTDLCRATVAHL